MKKTFFTLVVIATMAVMASCTKDPVHNGDPVDPSFAVEFPLETFHQLGQAGDTLAQRELVNKFRRQLTLNVLRHYPQIKDEKNIHFILGSGYAKDVLSGSGKKHSGKFKNELIIIIDDPAVKTTLFLACGNGMLSPLQFSSETDFGTAEKWRFTIQKGQGLATYIPQLREWGRVASELNIPIKDKDGNVVDEKVFYRYLGKYQSLLFEGDVIDLLEGKVYNKAGQEVQFDRRMQETEKANAEAAAKAKKVKKRR